MLLKVTFWILKGLKMLSVMDRFIIIFEKSKLSMSKFATILGKDRRTLLTWIENKETKSLS